MLWSISFKKSEGKEVDIATVDKNVDLKCRCLNLCTRLKTSTFNKLTNLFSFFLSFFLLYFSQSNWTLIKIFLPLNPLILSKNVFQNYELLFIIFREMILTVKVFACIVVLGNNKFRFFSRFCFAWWPLKKNILQLEVSRIMCKINKKLTTIIFFSTKIWNFKINLTNN